MWPTTFKWLWYIYRCKVPQLSRDLLIRHWVLFHQFLLLAQVDPGNNKILSKINMEVWGAGILT